jgi:hypothetical protein
MGRYEEIVQKIITACLSDKNIVSVYENLIYELKNENINALHLYKSQVLCRHVRQMMRFLCQQFRSRLKSDNFVNDPKKTIILMNAMVIQKILIQMREQLRVNKQNNVQLRTVPNPSVMLRPQRMIPAANPNMLSTMDNNKPSRPLYQFSPQPLTVQGESPTSTKLSISIDDLIPKRKRKPGNAISIKRLDKLSDGSFQKHEWWLKQQMERQQLRAIQEQLSVVAPSNSNEIDDSQYITPIRDKPWKMCTIHSADRDIQLFPNLDRYTIPVQWTQIASIYLYAIDIPVEGKPLDDGNNKLYYSEDDDPMTVLSLPPWQLDLEDMGNISYLETYLRSIATIMSEQSFKYNYRFELNRYTQRIKIRQLPKNSQSMNKNKNTLHLYFEQTQHNCAQWLGFQRQNYRDDIEFEGDQIHGFNNVCKYVHMIIEEISSDPILTIKVELGKQRKKQVFPSLCIWNVDLGHEDLMNLEQLTIEFVDDNNKNVWISDKDHIITFKYYYIPSHDISQQQQEPMEDEDNMVQMHENEQDIETIQGEEISEHETIQGEEISEHETIQNVDEWNHAETEVTKQDDQQVQSQIVASQQKKSKKRLPLLDV